eukprot:1079479-Pyramimonas_sp.AAC.1
MPRELPMLTARPGPPLASGVVAGPRGVGRTLALTLRGRPSPLPLAACALRPLLSTSRSHSAP